ncbi:MAG: beta-propeller domain-containing protein, partial [Gammaproteobacteria bacterium]|nr:beta-propeller domain-containing protein [Gammaproteobacteria bacterium]
MRITAVYSLAAALLLLAACNNSSDPATAIEQADTPIGQVALKPMQNCMELQNKLIDNWVENLVSYQRYTPNQFNDVAISSLQEEGSPSSTLGDIAQPDDVSQTNTQEAGVDEADRVKADSEGNLYIAQQDRLIIADAWPAQSMNILSTLELDGSVSGLYLSEQDNLIVALVRAPFVTPINTVVADASAPYIWWNPKTDLVFIDISDKAKPTIQRRLRLDG